MKTKNITYLLLGEFVVLGLASHLLGQLKFTMSLDSWHYVEFSQLDPFSRHALTLYRNMGYPVFLKICYWLGLGDEAIPYVQYGIYCVAIFFSYWVLVQTGVSALMALAFANSLLFGNIFSRKFFGYLNSEPVSFVLIIISYSLLTLISARKSVTRWHWVSFAVAVALTYWVRPAFQILIVVFPITGCLMFRVCGQTWSRCAHRLFALGIATFLPFLMISTFKWWMTGTFRLSNYSGRCLFGFGGQFLTKEMVPRLPGHLQSLADEVLRMRPLVSKTDIQRMWAIQEWNDPAPRPGDLIRHFVDIQFDYTMWGLGQVLQGTRYGKDFYRTDSIAMDDELGELAREVIKMRPEPYILWVIKSFLIGMDRALRDTPGMLFALAVCGCVFICLLFKVLVGQPLSISLRFNPAEKMTFLSLVIFNGFFVPINTLITVLFTVPAIRHVAEPNIFLPTILVFLAVGVGTSND